MRFDMNNIHTIFESAKSKNCVPSEHADKSGSKIDATLGDSDLIGLFDNICPICGDVFASMKDAAADPKNLKLTMVKTEDLGEATKIYIEAVEFATFCEAADLNIGEAAEEILDTCKGMVPGSNDFELHVVFPSEALNKGELGSTRFGRDVRNDWAMQLLTGCRRYGIHVNSGVEDGEPVVESAYKKAMNEAASKKPLGYEACIKRDKALIKREVNAASKEVYKTFKDNISSHYEKYMDEFYKKNKTAPKFDGLTHETDLYAIELNTDAYVDICLFYQDRVCKLLNKSEKLKALGYKFETEDYPGIFIRNAAAHAIKEAAEDMNDEAIEEGFGRHGFRDVKPLRDDKDGNKDDDKFTTSPDGSKWQNSIDLPDDNSGWVNSINLDEAVHTYSGYPYAGKHFKGVAIEYYASDGVTEITKEQKERFNADFTVVKAVYNKLFKEKFIPWLTKPYKDEKEKSDCVRSLDLYNVTYYARKDNAGEIEFQYTVNDPGNPSNEPVAFCIHVKGKEIIKAYGYDI